ncbi:MAG TPA: MiaB/RimO family radical SAM methylthiotransferase [Thermoleophilia bacterium]|nr:MiaB/RimO family radical SAM methylthiotransferase [Thermoleophilia bacterium]
MGHPGPVRQLPLRPVTGSSFFIQTLGCPKNEADSDALEARLRAAGHRPAAAGRAAVVVVNTCGFIDAAKEESIEAILDASAAAHARGARVAAVGCLVERYRDELAAEIPEVDLWCGLDTAPLLAALAAGEATATAGGAGAAVPVPRRPRPVSAYVKISDGCDRRCSFCAIPLIKGDYETVAAAEVLRTARAALAAGARELVLVGQDTSRWAQPGWGGVSRLLGELAALEPAPDWLRLLYLQPEGIDDALLEALAAHAVPYVDVPLQHASGAVLRRMRRSGDGDAHLALLQRIRAALPGAAVRSTFIAGFPGETDAEFEELVGFVRDAGLAVAGVFVYDEQEGTAAAGMPGAVPHQLALERAARLGEVIDREAERFWSDLAGATVDVLVERGASRPGDAAIGRIALQAPDVDGRTTVRGARVRRGDLVSAVVGDTLGYDVEAVAATGGP